MSWFPLASLALNLPLHAAMTDCIRFAPEHFSHEQQSAPTRCALQALRRRARGWRTRQCDALSAGWHGIHHVTLSARVVRSSQNRPRVGDIVSQKNGPEIETVLISHYETLLTRRTCRNPRTARREYCCSADQVWCGHALPVRCRCENCRGRHAYPLPSRLHAAQAVSVWTTYRFCRRVLVCDAATGLASTHVDMARIERERNALVKAELAEFQQSVEAVSERLDQASQSVESAANFVASAASQALQKSQEGCRCCRGWQ